MERIAKVRLPIAQAHMSAPGKSDETTGDSNASDQCLQGALEF